MDVTSLGYTDPSGFATGKTRLFKIEDFDEDVATYDKYTYKELEVDRILSLLENYDTIVIGIVGTLFDPLEYRLAVGPPSPNSPYKEWEESAFKNNLVEIYTTVLHELYVHTRPYLLQNKKPQEDEHAAYFGDYSSTTPSITEAKTLSKYRNTLLYKHIAQIESLVAKVSL